MSVINTFPLLMMSLTLQMDSEANEMQHKQERLRTRWTPSLDKVFAGLVVEQIKLGNRPNNIFDKKTWNYIRDEFNRQTNLHFNNNQLRKHLDVLRTRYYNLKSASDQNDALDDSCYIGFDLWEDIGVFLSLSFYICLCFKFPLPHNFPNRFMENRLSRSLNRAKPRSALSMSSCAQYLLTQVLMGSMPNQVTMKGWINLLGSISHLKKVATWLLLYHQLLYTVLLLHNKLQGL